MGNWKRRHLLISFFAVVFSVGANAASDISKSPLNLSIQVVERDSRVELSSQTEKIEMSGKSQSVTLVSGKILKGSKVTITARPVKINSESGFTWIEANLSGSKGQNLSYATTTVQGRKFSLGLGFQDPTDPKHQLILMLDSTATEP